MRHACPAKGEIENRSGLRKLRATLGIKAGACLLPAASMITLFVHSFFGQIWFPA